MGRIVLPLRGGVSPAHHHKDKHSVLFSRNVSQDVQLAKYLFSLRFFLTARGWHHIL